MSKQPTAQPTRDRTWDQLFALIPFTADEAARRMQIARASFYNLRNGEHGRPPLELLAKVVEMLVRWGTVDGSPVPQRSEFVRAWRRAFLEGHRL